ncbi:hypothetical protein CPAR01_14542, partial [Colletotrichum paranaense]
STVSGASKVWLSRFVSSPNLTPSASPSSQERNAPLLYSYALSGPALQACQGVYLASSAHWSRPAYLSLVTAQLVVAFRSDTTTAWKERQHPHSQYGDIIWSSVLGCGIIAFRIGDQVNAPRHKPQSSRCSISIPRSYCMHYALCTMSTPGPSFEPCSEGSSCVSYPSKLTDRQLQLHRALTANVNSLAANIRRSPCTMVTGSANFRLPLADRQHRSTFCWGLSGWSTPWWLAIQTSGSMSPTKQSY